MKKKGILLSILTTLMLVGCVNETDELKVVNTNPSNNTKIEKNSNIEIYFDDILKNDLNLSKSVFLMDGLGNIIKSTKTIDRDKIILNPVEDLELNTHYSVFVSKDLVNIFDGNMTNDYKFYFNILDETAPVISNIYPDNSSENISNNILPIITYNENIDITSVNEDNVYIIDSLGNKVSITISVDNNKILLKPNSSLLSNSSYIINVKRYIKDKNGNFTNESFTSKFTTSDILLPYIEEINIGNGVSINKNESIYIKFNEPMNSENINENFYLRDATNLSLIPMSISYIELDNKYILTPSSDLISLKNYILEVSKSNKDISDNEIEDTKYYSFSVNDSKAPVIVNIIPDNLSGNINVNTDITIQFDEAIDVNTLITNNIEIGDGTVYYNKTLTFNDITNELVINLSVPLNGLTNYQIKIRNLKDIYGNEMPEYTSTFITREDNPPYLLSSLPFDKELGIATDSQIFLDFNENLDISTVNNTNIKLVSQMGKEIPTDVYYFDKRIILKPQDRLKNNEKYNVKIKDITDENENKIVSTMTSFYTTDNLSSSSMSFAAVSNNNIGYVSGRNDEGQLGLGDKVDRNTPTILPGKWQKLKICIRHGVGLSIDGTVWAWGSYRYGKRGEGTITNISDGVMNQIGTKSDWVDIDCNADATYLLNNKNELYASGLNNYFQLSNGNNINQANIVLSETNVLKVNSFGNTMCLIKEDKKMYCIGYNNNSQAGVDNGNGTVAVLTNIDTKIYNDILDSSYYNNGMGITEDDNISSWGYNNYNNRGTSGLVKNPISALVFASGLKFKEICSGDRHTMALTTTGELYTMGTNSYNAMNNSSIGILTKVTAIDGIILPKISDIACNWYGTTIMDTDGIFWVWGRNSLGQKAGATAVGVDVTVATKITTD